jgi:hypothetical protein
MNGESKFRKGDRVYARWDNPSGNRYIQAGDTGTVVDIDTYKGDPEHQIGIRWDEEIKGHNCDGYCEPGHGWYVRAKAIEFIPEPEHEDFEPATDEELMRFLYGREA